MSQLAWDRAQGPPIGWSGRALARQQRKLARGTKDEEHAMSAKFNSEIAVIGIDIGKNSFHIPQTHIAWSRRSADASQICAFAAYLLWSESGQMADVSIRPPSANYGRHQLNVYQYGALACINRANRSQICPLCLQWREQQRGRKGNQGETRDEEVHPHRGARSGARCTGPGFWPAIPQQDGQDHRAVPARWRHRHRRTAGGAETVGETWRTVLHREHRRRWRQSRHGPSRAFCGRWLHHPVRLFEHRGEPYAL